MGKHSPDIDHQSPAALDTSHYGAREVLDFQISKGATRGNRLVTASLPLLGLSIRVRQASTDVNVETLLIRAKQEIETFERILESHDYDSATVLAARYVLCTMVDESVLSQEWGAESSWSAQPLLSHFHNETWGGEKFFAILERIKSEPEHFGDLLELVYLCQGLGFEGQYHVIFNGNERLQNLLNSTRSALLSFESAKVPPLFSAEENIVPSTRVLERRFPVWGIPILAMMALIIIFQVIDTRLDNRIETLAHEAITLSQKTNAIPDKELHSQATESEVK